MPEISYISIDRNKQLGNKAVRLAGLVRECQELAEALLNIADRQNDGADFSEMENQFGLVPGDGSELRTQLLRAHNILNNSGAELTGSQRIAQLTEFTSRVGGQ